MENAKRLKTEELKSKAGEDARPGSADASARRAYLADHSASAPYLGGVIWLSARRHSAGTHLSAMMQKSLQGGWPVYSASISKWRLEGKVLPSSHRLMVLNERPRSAATCFKGRLCL